MEDRFQEIKEWAKAFDGDFTAQAFGYECDGQAIMDDIKWLIEKMEQTEADRDYWKSKFLAMQRQ